MAKVLRFLKKKSFNAFINERLHLQWGAKTIIEQKAYLQVTNDDSPVNIKANKLLQTIRVRNIKNQGTV